MQAVRDYFLPTESSALRRRVAVLISSALLVLASAPSSALVLNFETSNQSMWQSGTAGQLDESVFVGTQWDTDPVFIGGFIGKEINTPSIPSIQITPAIPRKLITPAIPRKLLVKAKKVCVFGKCITTPAVYSPAIPAVYSPAIPAVYSPAVPGITIDTTSGAQVDVSSEGKVGLEFSVKADAGSVNANVAFDASLAAPEEIAALELFSLATTSTLKSSSAFDTLFPTLSARADLIAGVQVDVGGEVCAVGNCAEGTATLGGPPATIELISFNEDNNGKIRLLGDDNLSPAAFNFGEEISITGPTGASLGGATVYVPNMTTNGDVVGDALSSAGSVDILKLNADLDGIALTALGLPPVTGAELDTGFLNIGYDLLDLDFGPIVEILQHFELDPTLMVDLAFSAPIFVEGFDDQRSSLTAAIDALPRLALMADQSVEVTPTYWLDADLHNLTQLGLDAEFTLDVLKASFSLNARLGGVDLTYDLGELGPLFEYAKRFDVADLPALVDKTFGLGGFNSVVGDVFSLSTVVGEPEKQLADAVATMVTGSPVELTQLVSKPDVDSFDFSFDYLFGTATGVLDVFLGDTLIATLESSGVMDNFATFTTSLETDDFFAAIDELLLKFVLDGPTGSVMLLDNVLFPTVQNGNFNLGSLTGRLTNWDSAVPAGSTGFVGVSQFAANVPEPGVGLLMLTGLISLFAAMRRRRGAIGA